MYILTSQSFGTYDYAITKFGPGSVKGNTTTIGPLNSWAITFGLDSSQNLWVAGSGTEDWAHRSNDLSLMKLAP